MLERIDAIDRRMKSYVTVMGDRALGDARRADEEIAKGQVRGQLHGVPVAVKDLLWTTDAPTSHGMPINKEFMAAEDATAVCRLRDAGAVILGKLQQTEGAFADHHPDVVPPVNPWGDALWPGVSSSGSGVSVASGLSFGALGTDTGGSIRFPSAANGITGIKPTWSRVSRFGACELGASLDHIGPLARCTADTAALLFAIAGADPKDPTASQEPVPDYLALMTRGLVGMRVGIDPAWTIDRVDTAAQNVLKNVLALLPELGATVEEIKFPDAEQAVQDWVPLCSVETAVYHEETFPSRRDEYGPGLAGLIDTGRNMGAMDYQKLLLRRADFRGRVNELFQRVDLLLVPVSAESGLTMERMTQFGTDEELFAGTLRYTCPFDISGHPTITLMGGVTADNTPVAFQFVAGYFDETSLVRAGWGYQQATDWHRHHPEF
jgi:amidase